MSTGARPHSPAPSPAPILVSAEHAHDALTRALIAERENRQLRRDVKSLESRVRTFRDVINRRSEAVQIAAIGGGATLEPTLTIARLLETQGKVPVVRWRRDDAGVITGVELAIAVSADERTATDEDLIPRIGMAAIDDGEDLAS